MNSKITLAPRYVGRALRLGCEQDLDVEVTAQIIRPGLGRLLTGAAELTIAGGGRGIDGFHAALPMAWEPHADHVDTILLLETAAAVSRVLDERDLDLVPTTVRQALTDPSGLGTEMWEPTETDVLDAAWVRHHAASSRQRSLRRAASSPTIDFEEHFAEVALETARHVRSDLAPGRRLAVR